MAKDTCVHGFSIVKCNQGCNDFANRNNPEYGLVNSSRDRDRMKTIETKPVHASFKKDLAKFLETYDDKLSAEEMLAVTSQVVGMMVAMQDQRKYSSSQVMELVSINIQTGNATAVADLIKSQGKMQ